jgi:hypothetical protein
VGHRVIAGVNNRRDTVLLPGKERTERETRQKKKETEKIR